MIPGKDLVLGEKTYTIPPIPFGVLKKHKDLLGRAMRGEIDPATVFEGDLEKMFDCVYLTLKRNYPDLTEEALGQDLDVRNLPDAFTAMMSAAGFQEKSKGEALPAKI